MAGRRWLVDGAGRKWGKSELAAAGQPHLYPARTCFLCPNDFANLSQEERDALRQWNCLLYLPLHAGNTLIGVLGLGPKREQATYTPEDFNRLTLLAGQIGPLFHLCLQLYTLRQTYFLEASEHQDYIEQARRWEAVAQLNQQFMHLISPDIRKALGTIEMQWQRTLNEANRSDALITLPDNLTAGRV